MNMLFFGKDLEERKEMIIALLVIALFGWLGFEMGWLGNENETSSIKTIEQTTKASSDTDNDGVSNANDLCPLLVGLVTNKGCPRDIDGDGVFDNNDQCPKVSGLEIDNGCPARFTTQQKATETVSTIKSVTEPEPIDSDGDGVFDIADQCPNIAGTSKGCPEDTDADGITDDKDRCKDVAGTIQNNGCPVDSDNDGIVDNVDKCPNNAGIVDNMGCPLDSDNDSVADTEDRCPNKVGVIQNNGCPLDADNDGVADTEDKCPDKAGVVGNNGCPEVKITEDERKVIDEAISSVRFISGSSRLTESSKSLLDKVSKLLIGNSDYKLLISGHTDSSGDDGLNLKLSKARAFSVFTYLISKGIPDKRMNHNGFGETQPIASNGTQKGRLKNRRVELKLHY